MDVNASAVVRASVPEVFGVIEDLSTYPRWLSIVASAAPAPALSVDEGPAWLMELVARIGPLSRRKRVRMVRTLHDGEAGQVRFERREGDQGQHSPWVLTGHAVPSEKSQGGAGEATTLDVNLHYGGGTRLPGIDILLRQEARRAGERLEDMLRRPDQEPRGT